MLFSLFCWASILNWYLNRFYNAENSKDEIITVGRVERGVAATPVWRKQKTTL
jgi:hypothetical protein